MRTSRSVCPFFAAGLAVAAAAPLAAETGKSQMTVGVREKPVPVVHGPRVYPYDPYLRLRPRKTIGCEQDRLLTDTTPCGKDTAPKAGEAYP